MRNYIFAVLTIVAIASCAKKTAPTKTTAGASDGVSLYRANCMSCHGANGVEGKAKHLDHLEPKNETVDIITNGRGKMPSFKAKLSAQEIDKLADFVAVLEKKNSGK